MAKIKHISTATYEDNPKRYNEDIENGLVYVNEHICNHDTCEHMISHEFNEADIVVDVTEDYTRYAYDGVSMIIYHQGKAKKTKSYNKHDICKRLKQSVIERRFAASVMPYSSHVDAHSNAMGDMNVIRT